MAKFRLEPVLKLRRHREDDRKRDLADALAVENRHKETTLHFAELRTEHLKRMRQGQEQRAELDIRSLIEHRAYIGLLDREIGRQLTRVARAEHETGRRRQKLAEAMVDRKALEVLRDRARAAEKAAEARAEGAELDEVAARIWTDRAGARADE